MALISSLILVNLYHVVFAAFCKKEFFYHQYYSYGYDIYCNNLDAQTLTELTETIVYNEIKLSIENSNLENTKWHIVKHLPKLREINISYCQLHPTLFFELKNLNLLNIQHSQIHNIESSFLKGLLNLQQLILRNNSLENTIFQDFKDLDMLTVLNLNNNNINGIFSAVDYTFYNLKQVFLQHNQIRELGNISCLKYIEELYLDFNSINKLYHLGSFANLKVLSLNNNNMENLETIRNLNKLESLSLVKNKLTGLNKDDLHGLNNLKRLNLGDNQIYSISDTFFSNMLELRYVNLFNNKVDNINFKHSPKLGEINMSNNMISLLQIFANSTKLRKLDVSNNNIREVDQYIFSKLSNLTILNLSHNQLRGNIYDASFFGLINLEELQMENTSTSYLPDNVFIFSTKLKVLNLSKNKLSEFATHFEKLANLEILNISYNKLEELEYSTIKNLKNIKVIDIEGNSLRNVEYESIIDDLHKLITINIKSNLLTCEFLSRMIKFFTNKHVHFTINEEFHYDKENVAGVYCKEMKNRLNDSSLVLEGNRILKQLYNLTKNNTTVYTKTLSRSVTYGTIFAVLALIILSVGFYKTYVYLKKRHYCSDQFELIDRDKY